MSFTFQHVKTSYKTLFHDVRVELVERPHETAKIDTFNALFRSHLGYDDNYGVEESLDAANLERTKRQ